MYHNYFKILLLQTIVLIKIIFIIFLISQYLAKKI